MTEPATIATNLVTVTVHVPEVDWSATIGTVGLGVKQL